MPFGGAWHRRCRTIRRGLILAQGTGTSMGIAGALFAIAAAAVVAAWAWLGASVQMPPSPLASGEKLYCVSYSPFRGSQSPLGPEVPVNPRQIDEDLAQLKHITDCVRTYSVDYGLDQIAEIAKRHGIKVLQGLWLANLPGKDVFVGEFGWPSAGRMREGALPSPVNQARTMHEVLEHAKRENYRVNLIEAYDQPWKRQLEGTVGGHWGLFGAYRREAKFTWGGVVSNHPQWHWQAAGGVAFAAVIFATALAVGRRMKVTGDVAGWLRIAAIATAPGILIGWTLANVPLESLTVGDWLRSLAWVAAALVSPVVAAAAVVSGTTAPPFAHVLGRAAQRPRDPVALGLGVLRIALAVLAVQAALGLMFDPRYRDFLFAPLTAATVPLLLATRGKPAMKGKLLGRWKRRLQAPAAETAVAATLTVSAIYIVGNESFANWQAVWFAAALLALAFTVLQVQD